MRMRILLVALPLAGSLAASAQEPPAVRERLEVREVPVLVDVERSWRERSAAELRERLVVLEGGVAREPVTFSPLAGPGGSLFARVVVAFDRVHCVPESTAAAAVTLAEQSAALTGLGAVEVASLGRDAVERWPATRDAAALAERLRAVGADACRAPTPERPEAAALAGLDCPGTPCLLVWVGAGWGAGTTAEAALAAAGDAGRRLAGQGWCVLAFAPLPPAPEGGPTVAQPPAAAGERKQSWTINVLDPAASKSRGRPEADYERYVDLELASARRIVAATAGELAIRGEELGGALSALRGRTLLYYRTDRPPGADAVSFELRLAGEGGARLKAPEWAPALRP